MISSASTKRVANAVGGKTARACDSCLKKRARWYCAADDAFLCQSCDSSLHSANFQSGRHERVRLQTASFKSFVTNNVPSWPHRKSRTHRNGKSRQVPEVGSDDQASNEEEIAQRMIHRVPIYDPFVAEEEEEDESLRDFLASEMDMTEFAADVESLLGKGVNQELGLVTECIKEEKSNGMVKEEETVSFELGFEYDEELSPELCWGGGADREIKGEVGVEKKHKLRLDYEAVISAWGSQGGSPWTTGSPPDYFPQEPWPDCLGTCETELHHPNGEHINGIGGGEQKANLGDGDREARVSRYREKRRTRLFSKKIRYEVRKLNAEKRPRMKGRFVKRSIFPGAAFPLLHQ